MFCLPAVELIGLLRLGFLLNWKLSQNIKPKSFILMFQNEASELSSPHTTFLWIETLIVILVVAV